MRNNYSFLITKYIVKAPFKAMPNNIPQANPSKLMSQCGNATDFFQARVAKAVQTINHILYFMNKRMINLIKSTFAGFRYLISVNSINFKMFSLVMPTSILYTDTETYTR